MATLRVIKGVLTPNGPNSGMAIAPVVNQPAQQEGGVALEMFHEGVRIAALLTVQEATQVGVSLIQSAERAHHDHRPQNGAAIPTTSRG